MSDCQKDYPEHLNPFKKRSGLRGSFRRIGRFLEKPFKKHEEPKTVQVRPRKEVIVDNKIGENTVTLRRPQTEAFPRSRFQERVKTCAPSIVQTQTPNPFEDERDETDSKNKDNPEGTGTLMRKQRRKKRAPLPPNRLRDRLDVPDHHSSTMSITSYETDCSSYTNLSDNNIECDGELKDEVLAITSEIQKFCTDDEPVDSTTPMPDVVVSAEDKKTYPGNKSSDDNSTPEHHPADAEVSTNEENTIAISDKLQSDDEEKLECERNDALVTEQENIVLNNSTDEIEGSAEESNAIVDSSEPINDTANDKNEHSSLNRVAIIECNNDTMTIRYQDTNVSDEIKSSAEEENEDKDTINEADIRISKLDPKLYSKFETNADEIEERTYESDTRSNMIKARVSMFENLAETNANIVEKTADDDDTTHNDDHNNNNSDICYIDAVDNEDSTKICYVESKSIYVTGSKDELDKVDIVTEKEIYITGSCDELEKMDCPVPKIRKNKPSKNALLGSEPN